MNKPLIVCALEVETQDQLKDYDVLYTGVGKVNATIRLMEKLGGIFAEYAYSLSREGALLPSIVINYGTAGSRKYKKGELIDCTKFIQRDMDVTGLGFQRGETPYESEPPVVLQTSSSFNPIGKHATCGTGDSFVEDKSQYYGEVVDMEAYALAKVCTYYAIPFISFKYISDGADGDANNDWEENAGKGIVEFKKKVLQEI